MMKKYLLDTNIFIQSHKLYYHPSFCESFWTWLNHAHDSQCFFTIDKVKDELLNSSGKDELATYIREGGFKDTFFVPSLEDAAVASKYGTLMKWATNSAYNDFAKNEFANSKKADAALIATAMAHDYLIVTAEKSEPASKKSIKIPDAANPHNVETISLIELLRLHAVSNFGFKND
jgi:hypothetical protein